MWGRIQIMILAVRVLWRMLCVYFVRANVSTMMYVCVCESVTISECICVCVCVLHVTFVCLCKLVLHLCVLICVCLSTCMSEPDVCSFYFLRWCVCVCL